MKGIEQHQNCAERNDDRENQLILPFLDVDALYKRIYPGKVVRQVVESILKPLERFSLTFEGLLCFNRYANLIVDQVVGAKTTCKLYLVDLLHESSLNLLRNMLILFDKHVSTT